VKKKDISDERELAPEMMDERRAGVEKDRALPEA